MFFSYNYQNIHFIAISTETDYPGSPKKENFGNHKDQLKWLEEDLVNANLPENKQKRPFIIVYGHRPMYTGNEAVFNIPIGYSKEVKKSFEPLFKKYNVDIFFNGHVHDYQRNYPVYNDEVTSRNYNNPTSTIHILSGAAGNKEGLNPVTNSTWLAFGAKEFGFGIVDVVNNTQLIWTFYKSSNMEVLDKITINKDN